MLASKNVRRFGSVLGMLLLLLVSELALAQQDQNVPKPEIGIAADASTPAAPALATTPLTPEKQPPAAPNVTYAGELLKIDAFNSTLADILKKIATLTGADIDVPDSARTERMVADLGPGPPRKILTSLLTDTDFDFVITSQNNDPESILMVVLTPRGHTDGSARGTVLAERPATNFRRTAAERMRVAEAPAENQQEDSSATAAPESAPAEANAAVSQPDTSAAAMSPAPEIPAAARNSDPPTGQPEQRSMNQQLMQMYKQREQQIQEQRASSHPTNP